MAKKGKVSLLKWEERGGLKVKRPLIPFLPMPNRGGGLGASAAVNPAAPGLEGGRDRGEKGEGGLRGIDPQPHLLLGCCAEAARLERAAMGGAVCGGGAAAAREEASGGCDGLGCGGATPRAFYRRASSVRRRG